MKCYTLRENCGVQNANMQENEQTEKEDKRGAIVWPDQKNNILMANG